jgi:hypothetical protein
MLNLQRQLDSLKACNCPEDCRGQGRSPVLEPGRRSRDFKTGDNSLLFGSLDSSDDNDDDSEPSGLPGVDEQQTGSYLPGEISLRARVHMGAKPLARARASKSITLEKTGEKGKLRMSLGIYTDPQGYRTRLGYYADLFFRLDGSGKDGEPDPEEFHIGFISSWRLSKQPYQYGHGKHQPWVMEWLHGDLGDASDDSRPLKKALRLLYHEESTDSEAGGEKVEAGQVRDNMTDDIVRSALDETGSELVFIEMLWIKYKDDKTGFQVSSDC